MLWWAGNRPFLSTKAPVGGFAGGESVSGTVLTWGRLEALGVLDLQIYTNRSTHAPGGVLTQHFVAIMGVGARTWLESLLFFGRTEIQRRMHAEYRSISSHQVPLPDHVFGSVGARARHFKIRFHVLPLLFA